jgi:hypothetical protein
MGLTVSQPEDVDVAVPSRWLAIYVVHGGGGIGGGGGGRGGAVAGTARGSAGAASLTELESCAGDALEVLLRDRFAPQVRMPAMTAAAAASPGTGTRGAGPSGMWAARVRQLRRLGWRVVVVDVEAWRALTSDVEREAYLLRVLRGRA